MTAEETIAEVRSLGRRAADREGRRAVDAFCRLVDVRKQFDVEATVAAEVLEILLANDGATDGYDLKCANTVLKALDLRHDIPGGGDLRIRALGIVDRERS